MLSLNWSRMGILRNAATGWLTLAFLVFPAVMRMGHGEEIVVRAGHVVTMNGTVLEPGQVLIRDGKIQQVGTDVSAEQAKVVDLGDGWLVPGLVNPYFNAAIAGGDAERTEELTPEYDVSLVVDWRDINLSQQRAAGVTTLGLMPGTENVIAGQGAAIKSGGNRVVRRNLALVVAMNSDPTRGNSSRRRPDSIYVRQPTNRMGVVWMLRAQMDQAAKWDQPQHPLVQAMRGQLPVFGVARTSYDIRTLLELSEQFGWKPVVVGAQEAYELKERIAEAKVPVILGPSSTVSPRGPESTRLAWALPKLLDDAEVEFAFSGEQALEEARFSVRRGLDAESALAALTTVPAKLLGLAGQVGKIDAGFDADLIAFKGHPLEFTSAIDWVMVDGNIYDEGN